MLISEHFTGQVSVAPRVLHRALDVVMGSTGVRDPAAAEEILVEVARHLHRPLDAVAEDLACGRDFAGRPGWL